MDAHFATLTTRYFQIHTAKDILEDVELVHDFMRQLILEDDRALSPVTAWRDEPDRGYNVVKICTWDRAGLFSKIAGSLSASGLNILGAQIFTRADGIALDTFFVNDGRTGNLATPRAARQICRAARKSFDRRWTWTCPRSSLRQITDRPVYEAYAGEQMTTEIHFDNEASETRTLIEIQTEDRLGLLYAISQTFSELALDIARARIVTERGAAIDSFYVCELDGGKILLVERQKQIERGLRQAIHRLETVK